MYNQNLTTMKTDSIPLPFQLSSVHQAFPYPLALWTGQDPVDSCTECGQCCFHKHSDRSEQPLNHSRGLDTLGNPANGRLTGSGQVPEASHLLVPYMILKVKLSSFSG